MPIEWPRAESGEQRIVIPTGWRIIHRKSLYPFLVLFLADPAEKNHRFPQKYMAHLRLQTNQLIVESLNCRINE